MNILSKHLLHMLCIIVFLSSCQGKSSTQAPTNSALSSGDYYINQTWSQMPNGLNRLYKVQVPSSSDTPLGVVILLHGSGSGPDSKLNQHAFIQDKILVAPAGFENCWNVGAEASKAPDVEFIKQIILTLQTYNNVDATNITIIGSSNGSALLHRLIIELDTQLFQHAVSVISQLNTAQYNNGAFWYNSNGDNSYDQQKIPATGKRIITFNGTQDDIVPYGGGLGILNYNFLSAQESTYILAKAMGENGPMLSDNEGVAINNAIYKYEYLNGEVVHYKLVNGGHGLLGFIFNYNAIVLDFLSQ